MAFVSNPSSSEDSSLGTDLSNINMEDEKAYGYNCLDTC